MFGVKRVRTRLFDIEARLSELERAFHRSSRRAEVMEKAAHDHVERLHGDISLRVNEVHALVNNLATVLGLKRNVHSSRNVCPDMWVPEALDEGKPMKTVLEPTGRLRRET